MGVLLISPPNLRFVSEILGGAGHRKRWPLGQMGTSFGEGGKLVAMSQAVCRLGVSEFLIRGERAKVIVHQEKKAWHAEEMRRGHPGVGRGLTDGWLRSRRELWEVRATNR